MSSNELPPLVTLFIILVGVVVLVVSVAIVINYFSRQAYSDNYDLLREQIKIQDGMIDGLKNQMNSALLQYSKLIEELREEVEVLRWYVTEEGLPVPKDRRHAAELMARRKDEIDLAKRMKTEILEEDFHELRHRAKAMRLNQDNPYYEPQAKNPPVTQQPTTQQQPARQEPSKRKM